MILSSLLCVDNIIISEDFLFLKDVEFNGVGFIEKSLKPHQILQNQIIKVMVIHYLFLIVRFIYYSFFKYDNILFEVSL